MEVHRRSLGSRIQKLRLRQNRTMEEIARECGFTKGLLSKIERDRTMPPVATLMRIAAALGVTVGDLLVEDASQAAMFTGARTLAEAEMTRTDKGYRFHLFAGNRPEKLMQPFLFVARRGEIAPGGLAHGGEEFIYVLEGEMKFRLGHVTYHMRAGDSLYFDSEEEHDLEPVSEEVRYLGILVDAPLPDPRTHCHDQDT